MSPEGSVRRQKIRIWLGDLLIAEYEAEPDRASRYQRVMTPKFSGLRITVEPAGAVPAKQSMAVHDLPSERLWPLTVQ